MPRARSSCSPAPASRPGASAACTRARRTRRRPSWHEARARVKRLVILISGRGSNMQALLDAPLPAVTGVVISSNPAAGGLAIATARGVATQVVDHRAHADRETFDRALAQAVDAVSPDLIVLAGFMRVLTPWFVQRY